MAIDNDSIEELASAEGIVGSSVLVNTYRFRLDAIPSIAITIWIWFDVGRRDPYRFDLSHYVTAPGQIDAYMPGGLWYATEASALRRGMRAITDWIGQGVADGHEPDVRWLRRATSDVDDE